MRGGPKEGIVLEEGRTVSATADLEKRAAGTLEQIDASQGTEALNFEWKVQDCLGSATQVRVRAGSLLAGWHGTAWEEAP